MSEIRIETFKGDYDNDDAYNRVIGYISGKEYISGYGFKCDENISIIRQFSLSEEYSYYNNGQKLWHFIITFSDPWSHTHLLQMADTVSKYFSDKYQVFFGLDLERKGNTQRKSYMPHLHFCVNAFSYHPGIPPLSKDKMRSYLDGIQQYLSGTYNKNVTLQFQGKEG